MAKPGLIKTQLDDLTFKVNGLAMQTHNELKAGHAEKFYKRRLAELCLDAGLAVELEKRVEVWIGERQIGYLVLDLWIEENLVVECKSFPHSLGKDEIGQTLTYLAATGNAIGLLYNFGRRSLEFKRILAPKDMQEWQADLYRYIHKSPGMKPQPLTNKNGHNPILPIRFKSVDGKPIYIEIPSPSGAAIRLSASRGQSAAQSAYSASGVDIDAGNRAVELMKDSVRATYSESVLAGIGSFGGLFDASALQAMKSPVLVASTDGVGTKVKLASSVGRYRGIGHDIVNHCINDILVQGARPLFFMDYFATAHLDPEQTAEVVTGIAEACKASGVVLLGGETAEMPGVYQAGEFDVAGTIVGVVERENILPHKTLKAGDTLIGLASSGPHTNGYSLLRKIFESEPLDEFQPELGSSLADALLAPHRSYYHVLQPVLPNIKALVHITGGGFIENIPRVLPDNLGAEIKVGSWSIPPLWRLVQKTGSIDIGEMYRVFNMGIGMILIAEKDSISKIQNLIPETTFLIGQLTESDEKVQLLY